MLGKPFLLFIVQRPLSSRLAPLISTNSQLNDGFPCRLRDIFKLARSGTPTCSNMIVVMRRLLVFRTRFSGSEKRSLFVGFKLSPIVKNLLFFFHREYSTLSFR